MMYGNGSSSPEIGRRDFTLVGAGAAMLAASLGTGTESAQAQTASDQPPITPVPEGAPPGKIDVDRRGAIMLIGLNRPQAQNQLDPPMLIALGKAYHQFEHDNDLRVAVLHGIGPDFCLALDVPAYLKAIAEGTYPPKDPDVISPFATRPPSRTKPVVVAVHGRTWVVGDDMFLAADVRIAARDTRFRHPEVLVGTFPAAGAAVRLPREAGWANAMRYLLTGDEWTAEDAYRMGVVQEVTEPGKQLDRAIALAQKIADAAPLGVLATLASAHQAISREDQALADLLPRFQQILRSEDAKEGRDAVREHRKPVFRGT
jgi:enoyl-CoA hydratase